MQIDRASDYLYMHVQTISLATLANLVFQINVANGKNWIAIDFDNNEETDRASGYLSSIYAYANYITSIISLAALDSQVFQINEQTDRASDYLYMYMQVISLAALDSLVQL